ncbi:MAG: CvpA family protein [Clostridia bacterium]|nr:CvpA family protein [Clostridia bacterium]
MNHNPFGGPSNQPNGGPNWQDIFSKMSANRPPREPKVRKPRTPAKHGEAKALLATLLFALLLFYLTLPALNLRDEGFYSYIGMVLIFYAVVRALLTAGAVWEEVTVEGSGLRARLRPFKRLLYPLFPLVALVVMASIGSLAGAPLFRAASYASLLSVQEGEFTEDVAAVTYDQIPLLDKASAAELGARKLGTLADMVSQFEVASSEAQINYTQINYRGRPTRVTPLRYGDFFKWLGNQKEGLPAYLTIDMITQEVEVVRLESLGLSGMRYSESELFFRYLHRALRFRYPTFMFGKVDFEIDEEGTPYWVASRVTKRIGLFGGEDIIGAVLMNAVTGEAEYYPVEEVPTWVDNVFDPDLLMRQYDYYGAYQNGFWNATFGQKNVTMTTLGYNYIAMNDDVYMYTGVTSVGQDESNVGFILVNQRTKETKFYSIAGAEEYSAMDSAEGIVQHLDYDATFPLLLNIGDQPTYVLALKDQAGLVKMYAMVNVSRYHLVAAGNSIAETERAYLALLRDNDLYSGQPLPPADRPEAETFTAAGRLSKRREAVIEGTTMFFLRLEGDNRWYLASAADTPFAVLLNNNEIIRNTR